jgi:hypothetical protein
MRDTRTPLSTWFWGAYLITTQTPGMSAVQFQRQLDIKRYETAFNVLHKLRSGMVRPDRDKIGDEWPVEVDECYIGGATRGEGKGVHHKSLVVAAVEVRKKQPPKDPIELKKWLKLPARQRIYAGRLRLQLVPDRRMDMLTEFVKENIASKARILSDGWQGYNELMKLGYKHKPLVKRWLLGTHHGRVEPQHLQAYLNEYVFRFNRRFYPMTSFNSVLGLAARSVSPTYEELYSGAWEHPGSCPNIEFR